MTSETREFVDLVVQTLMWGGLIGVCAFAWFKGGAAERYGAVVFLVSSLGAVGFELSTHQYLPVVQMLMLDTLVALAFLALAIRFNSLWLGAAMIVKGLQLGLHATHLTDSGDAYLAGFNLYAVGLNLIALSILLIFFGATLASIRGRSAIRYAKAPIGVSARPTRP